jgi:hypothetical protein
MSLLLLLCPKASTGKPATFAGNKPHAECGAFDRFMNRLFYALGLLKTLE